MMFRVEDGVGMEMGGVRGGAVGFGRNVTVECGVSKKCVHLLDEQEEEAMKNTRLP